VSYHECEITQQLFNRQSGVSPQVIRDGGTAEHDYRAWIELRQARSYSGVAQNMRAQQKIWFWSGLTTYTFATCLCLRMALWLFLLPYLIRLNWFRFIDRVSPIQIDSSVRGSCLSWYSVDTNHESIRRLHTPRLTVYPCKCSFWVKSGFATRVYMNKPRMAFEWADQRRNPDRERTIGRYWNVLWKVNEHDFAQGAFAMWLLVRLSPFGSIHGTKDVWQTTHDQCGIWTVRLVRWMEVEIWGQMNGVVFMTMKLRHRTLKSQP